MPSSRKRLQFGKWLPVILAPALALGTLAATPSDTNREYQIKAAFLYQFLSFVKFPDSRQKTDSLVICIVGKDPFGSAIDAAFANRTLRGRPIAIHRHETLKDMHESASHLQIVFVSSNVTDAETAQLLQHVRTHPCLTIGETASFCQAGGMMSLRVEDNRIRFDANPEAATRAGIRISSQLLKLASRVISTAAMDSDGPDPRPTGKTE